MLARLEMTDGLGAIYPAMLNAILALRCLGYSEDDPQVIRARDEFEKLGIEEPLTRRYRSRPSACSRRVLRYGIRRRQLRIRQAGVARNDPRMIKAAEWSLKGSAAQR